MSLAFDWSHSHFWLLIGHTDLASDWSHSHSWPLIGHTDLAYDWSHSHFWLLISNTDLALCWKGLTFLMTAAEHSMMSGASPVSPYFRDRVLWRRSTSSLTSSSILTMNLAPPQYLNRRKAYLCDINQLLMEVPPTRS